MLGLIIIIVILFQPNESVHRDVMFVYNIVVTRIYSKLKWFNQFYAFE